MPRITPSEGEPLTATLPAGWHETPLLAYCHLAAAESLADRAAALAALVGLQPVLVVSNMRLYADLTADLPFLNDLPTGPAAPAFEHLGISYLHTGHLETISAGQLEGLLATLTAHEASPMLAAPALLALLYCPAGKEQTATVVAATTTAFETLPVSLAWPALVAFIAASGNSALRFQQYSALRSQAHHLLTTLQANWPAAGASRPWWRKPLPWLMCRWLRSAAGMLTT